MVVCQHGRRSTAIFVSRMQRKSAFSAKPSWLASKSRKQRRRFAFDKGLSLEKSVCGLRPSTLELRHESQELLPRSRRTKALSPRSLKVDDVVTVEVDG